MDEIPSTATCTTATIEVRFNDLSAKLNELAVDSLNDYFPPEESAFNLTVEVPVSAGPTGDMKAHQEIDEEMDGPHGTTPLLSVNAQPTGTTVTMNETEDVGPVESEKPLFASPRTRRRNREDLDGTSSNKGSVAKRAKRATTTTSRSRTHQLRGSHAQEEEGSSQVESDTEVITVISDDQQSVTTAQDRHGRSTEPSERPLSKSGSERLASKSASVESFKSGPLGSMKSASVESLKENQQTLNKASMLLSAKKKTTTSTTTSAAAAAGRSKREPTNPMDMYEEHPRSDDEEAMEEEEWSRTARMRPNTTTSATISVRATSIRRPTAAHVPSDGEEEEDDEDFDLPSPHAIWNKSSQQHQAARQTNAASATATATTAKQRVVGRDGRYIDFSALRGAGAGAS